MEASMSKNGVITIKPSDSIDEYALSKWTKDNKITCKNIKIITDKNTIVGFKKNKNNNK